MYSLCFFIRFDVADRLFFSLEASFNSVLTSLNDCKEITPDFFCLPEFLVNMNGKNSCLHPSPPLHSTMYICKMCYNLSCCTKPFYDAIMRKLIAIKLVC